MNKKMNIRALIFRVADAALRMGGGKRRFRRVLSSLRRERPANEAQLKKILKWSTENVAFYEAYRGFRGLEDFPVVNKTVIRENEARIFARGVDKAKLHKVSTSGSTGTPFVVWHDKKKRRQAAADTMAFSEFAGYHFGTRLYYVRAWDGVPVRGNWYSKLRNIVPVNNRSLTPEDFRRFLKTLEEDASEKSVLIYASTLTELFRFMKTENVRTTARVQAFITMSEALPDDVREGVSALFGAPVVSRYSDCECGLIAQQAPGEKEYRVNTESFFVEILKTDSDERAADGELGRIVVTDLYNYAMPIIRYDTGDMGVMETRGNAKTLTRVDGRRIDFVITTSGKLLSPHVLLNSVRSSFEEIVQYQLIKNGRLDYVMKLNLRGKDFPRESEFEQMLKTRMLGEDANVKFEYVDEIPTLASGKRKFVVNNWQPEKPKKP